MSIPCYELAGYEADDLLGTISRKCEADGWDCVTPPATETACSRITDRTRAFCRPADGMTARGI